jgi:hypothetical protein
MKPYLAILSSESQEPNPLVFGNKAVGLWRLLQCKVSIPPTVMVAAYSKLDFSDLTWIDEQLGNPAEFVVRSSSNSEDSDYQSLAGVFCSKVAKLHLLLDAVEHVRGHAATSPFCRQNRHPIPLLIQPRLGGPGGVYLSDTLLRRDALTLSILGPSAVTSGTTTVSDRISSEESTYRTALEICRGVAGQLNSIDLELIFNGGDWIFLQCRPLTQSLVDAQILGLSSYFPTWLPPLCGTLWVEGLLATRCFEGVHYDNGLIIRLSESQDSDNGTTASISQCEEAERFYVKVLFPKWESALSRLQRDLDTLATEDAYHNAKSAWIEFLQDYFTNPYEAVVSAVRASRPTGMAITPRVRKRMTLFDRAAQEVASEAGQARDQHERLLALPSVMEYLSLYGFQPLEGHDFSQPTLAEHPAAFLALLTQAGRLELPEVITPDARLRVAWLAEDDNDYKQRFCSLLRQSILRLGEDWAVRGFLPGCNAIWHLTAEEVEGGHFDNAARLGVREPFLLPEQPDSVGRDSRVGPFSAEILSPGRASGFANRLGKCGTNSILVRTVIETTDYPLLIRSAGAVVAIGTPQCHGAIFARDIGKPLYRCPAAVQTVNEGTMVSLHDIPATVELGGGAVHEK